ncbi:hypothetical protein ACQRBK_05190 [Peptoniphilaceae bacterium SGI.137]
MSRKGFKTKQEAQSELSQLRYAYNQGIV